MLTEAAEQELPLPNATLGCLYLKEEEIPKDTESGGCMVAGQAALRETSMLSTVWEVCIFWERMCRRIWRRP